MSKISILSISTLLLILIITTTCLASNGKEFESLPILRNGRVKPLAVHAKEIIKTLTGKSKIDNLGSTEIYTKLTLSAGKDLNLEAPIHHVDIKKLFNLKNSDNKISYIKLSQNLSLLRAEAIKIKEESSYKKSLTNLFHKTNLYLDIIKGSDWLIPTPIDNKINWTPFNNLDDNMKNHHSIMTTKEKYIKLFGDHYLIELTYHHAHLTHWAMLLTILAILSLLLFKGVYTAITLTSLSFLTQLAVLIFRVIISGRAPITNMYESVLFSGFGALFLGIIIALIKRDKIILFIALFYNTCTLFMISFADTMLSSAIGPLVPVLRDNFWLSIHVTTIVLSYGALALSWLLANFAIIQKSFIRPIDIKYFVNMIHTSLKFGTVLLAAGIITGGIWADYSWGRFWGWDPKETWSLIVLCIYIVILHGKSTSWISNERFIPFTALAFMSVMMAWFGVNILASGLHSYGFSKGGAIFLFSFFIIQILIVITSIIKKETVK